MIKTAVRVVLASCAMVSIAAADRLTELQEANRQEESCARIPASYAKARRDCESQGGLVHRWCDGAEGPVSCGAERETNDARLAVELAHAKIEKLGQQQAAAKRDDEVRQLDRDLATARRQLGVAEAALKARRAHVDRAIATLGKCLAHRRAVMNAFALALDKVRQEKGTPEITKVARALAAKYQASKSGHETQIRDKETALANCRAWRPL